MKSNTMYCISYFEIAGSIRQSYRDRSDSHAASKHPGSLSCQEAALGNIQDVS